MSDDVGAGEARIELIRFSVGRKGVGLQATGFRLSIINFRG